MVATNCLAVEYQSRVDMNVVQVLYTVMIAHYENEKLKKCSHTLGFALGLLMIFFLNVSLYIRNSLWLHPAELIQSKNVTSSLTSYQTRP